MFAAYRNPASAYRRIDVDTSVDAADPHRLIALLFEGAIAAIRRAVAAIEAKDLETKLASITRALRIVDEGLKASLDPAAGQLAVRLGDLYTYVSARLLAGSLHDDVDALGEAAGLLGQLHDAWMQIAPERAATAA